MILGCAAVVNVPVIFAPITLPVVDKLPALTVPVTLNVVRIPMLVILGWALVVTEPANAAVATFKLATCVVLVTISGAVPVATLDTSCPAVVIFPPLTLPIAVTIPAVPKLFTLAFPETVNTPLVTKLEPMIFPVAVINPAVPILPILALPLTDNDVNVPVLVIFGCAAVDIVPAIPAVIE